MILSFISPIILLYNTQIAYTSLETKNNELNTSTDLYTAINFTGNIDDHFFYTPNNKPDKIAVFIYQSEVFNDKQVNRYTEILKSRNFNIFIYLRDISDILSAVDIIDSIEEPHDKLFLYIYGHGYYHETEKQSVVSIGPKEFISSYQLYHYLKFRFDSYIKGFLVESCQSGHFVTTFKEYGLDNIIAMSTSNINENSYRDSFYPWGTGEGYFSKAFFNYLRDSSPSSTGYRAYCAGKENVSKDRYFLFIKIAQKQHPQLYIEPTDILNYTDELFTYN